MRECVFVLFGFAFVCVFVFACVFVFVRPLSHLKSLDTDDSVAAGGPVGNLTPEAKHRDIKAGLFSLMGGPTSVTQPDKRTRRNVIPTNQPFSFHHQPWSHPFQKLENFDQVNFSKVLWGFRVNWNENIIMKLKLMFLQP